MDLTNTNIMQFDVKGRIIGCGYCAFEKTCNIHNPKVNQAKQECLGYKHFQDVVEPQK